MMTDTNEDEMLRALKNLVHDIIIYDFLDDFIDDADFRVTVEAAQLAIAKAEAKAK